MSTDSSRPSSGSKPSKGWQPPTLEEMQAMLPQYEFISLLGRGGMGAVYKAQQVSLQRSVAIKVLPGDLIDDLEANFAERFKNEARTMAKMNHPGIVKVYDFGETQTGLLYIVMEFINGTDVSQMIRSQGKLPPDHALAITAHVCDALGYAHKNGVIHRDIKPANILMNQEGTVKVADFGLAKQSDAGRGLTKTNTAMGTPDFVAPEALAPGMVVDGRADLYAVGVMLYQMLTGEIPRGMWALPSEKVQCDPRYDQVILKAMQTDRDQRYQEAMEIRRDLDVILTMPLAQTGVQTIPAQQPAAGSAQPQKEARSSKPMPQAQAKPASHAPPVKKKSNDAMIYGVAAVVVGVLVALFVFSGGMKPVNKPTESAQGEASAKSVEVTAKPVNLLDIVDVKRDAIRGQWEKTPAGLLLRQSPGPQMLFFNHEPPEEYDFEIEFTLRGGFLEASQIIPLPGGGSVLWKMGFGSGDPTSFGFGPNLDGVKMDAPARTEAKVMRPRLQPGRRYRSLVEVREGSLRASIDGAEVLKWSGDQKRLKIDGDYASKNGRLPGIGGWGGHILFHQAELRAPGAPSTLAAAPAQAAEPPPPSFAEAPVSPLMSRGKELAERQKTLAAPLEPGVIDALAKVSFPTDADYQWTRDATGIQVKPAKEPGPYKSTVELPMPTSQDYAIEAWFTNVTHPFNDVGLCIPVGTQRRTTCWIWSRDGGWAGLGKVDGFDPQQPQIAKGCSTSFQLKPGELSFMRVEVRRQPGSVDIQFSLNGTLVAHYTGPTRRLILSTAWRVVKNHDLPCIGGREATFHRVTMQALGTATAAKAAVATTPPAPVPVNGDPYLVKLESGFKARYETDAQKPFLAAVATLNTNYIANGIAGKRAEAQSKGRSDEVAALDAEKAAVEQGAGVPAEDAANTPESLKALRGTYRAAFAKLEADRVKNAAPLYDIYVKALDAYVIELTKAGKIDEAKKAQALREEIAARRDKPISPPAASPATTGAASSSKDGFTNSLGMKFILVKGTDVLFCIHETRRQDYAAYAAANPGVKENWKNAGQNGIPCGDKDDHPVVGIRWTEAQDFCDWLSKKDGKTYRLPTDEEWSIAVGLGRHEKRSKGTTPEMLSDQERTEYPWGGDYPPKTQDLAGNFSDMTSRAKFPDLGFIEGYNDGFATTAPVMSFKPNKLGLYDMAGNVLEWVDDWLNEAQTDRVLRGGSFMETGTNLLSSHRYRDGPTLGRHYNGFRVVMVLSDPTSTAPR